MTASAPCRGPAGSPPVKPGDTIKLMSGDYGDVVIGDYSQPNANSDFVTVEAAPGQTPLFSTLYIRSTNKWVFKGVKVKSLFGANNNKQALVTVTDQGARSRPPTSSWRACRSARRQHGWMDQGAVGRSGTRGYREIGSPAMARTACRHDLRRDDRVAHP